jgi:hypothetical protein
MRADEPETDANGPRLHELNAGQHRTRRTDQRRSSFQREHRLRRAVGAVGAVGWTLSRTVPQTSHRSHAGDALTRRAWVGRGIIRKPQH